MYSESSKAPVFGYRGFSPPALEEPKTGATGFAGVAKSDASRLPEAYTGESLAGVLIRPSRGATRHGPLLFFRG